MSYTEGDAITFRTPVGHTYTGTFVKYAAGQGMTLVNVTSPDWPETDRRWLVAEDDILGPAEAPLQRGDVVLDSAGYMHVIIRVCSTGEQAEVFPGPALPDKIPNRDRGDWRQVATLTKLDAGAWQVGAAAAIDGVEGVWLVIEDGTELALRDPKLAGHVRLQKMFDGAGPSHLRATVKAGELRPIEANPAPAAATINGDPAYGMRLTALTREVVVPFHPAAYASIWHIVRQAENLQHALGLVTDAHIVQWCDSGRAGAPGSWLNVEAFTPQVPTDLLSVVRHNHAYYDDGVTPVVGPCRHLATCRTSLNIAEARAQRLAGQPRFAELDVAAERAARAELAAPDAAVEYAMSYTQHGASAPTVQRVPDLAAAAEAVRLMRELQATLGQPVDALLVARRGETEIEAAGDWLPVKVAPDAVGELAALRRA